MTIAPISRSFNGRTPGSGSGNRGSSPRREATAGGASVPDGPGLDAELSLASDGLVRHEGGVTGASLPEGALDAMVAFAEDFDARYPALEEAEGTYPLGLSGLTVCTTGDIALESGLPPGDVEDALGMFVKAKGGSLNAGIYMNADLLSSATREEAVSAFRHEYGHYVGWFLERSGVASIDEMVGAALGELLPSVGELPAGSIAITVSADLSDYAGRSWAKGLPGEVFAEAFRVWQEGGRSRLAAIMAEMADAALKGAL